MTQREHRETDKARNRARQVNEEQRQNVNVTNKAAERQTKQKAERER